VTHTTNIALCGPPSDSIFNRRTGGPFKPDVGLSGAVQRLDRVFPLLARVALIDARQLTVLQG
jgi:hypothetical protein